VKPSRVARGFTLVELLVVVAIIGILVSLLMPAVQSARESGRQTQCKNNLYQLGRAAQSHVSNLNHFPSSGWGYLWTGDPDMGFGASQPGGWIYNLLPYMELQNIHDMGKKLPDAEKRKALGEQKSIPLAGLICPTRRRAVAYPAVEISLNAAQPDKLAKTDYAANGGSNRILGNETTDTSCPQKYPNCNFPNHGADWFTKTFTGITGPRTEVQAAHIRDSMSATYFAGEKYLNPDSYATGNDGADNNSMYQGNDWDVNRWANRSLPPMQDTPGFDPMSSRFGSAHFGGFQVVMCDGSVHFINYQISPLVHEHLGNRLDGVTHGSNEWE